MKNKYVNRIKLIALIVGLPFIYGCGTGAGIGALTSFLFGAGGSGIGPITIASGPGGGDISGAGLATLHQPEPASMLLLGGGLMAMSYFKSKAKCYNR